MLTAYSVSMSKIVLLTILSRSLTFQLVIASKKRSIFVISIKKEKHTSVMTQFLISCLNKEIKKKKTFFIEHLLFRPLWEKVASAKAKHSLAHCTKQASLRQRSH